MKLSSFDYALGSLALALTRRCGAFIVAVFAAFIAGPCKVLGISSLPVVPTAGSPAVAATPTVAVAGAIKPTETPGSIVSNLNAQLDGSDADVKFVVLGAVDSNLSRTIMLPKTVSDGTALAGETLLCTIEPDGTTGDTDTWTATAEGGAEDKMEDVLEIVNGTAKPRRNVSSLVNALFDALTPTENAFAVEGQALFAIVVDQENENIKIYQGATAGTLTGELADISTEAAPPSPGTRSVLRGS